MPDGDLYPEWAITDEELERPKGRLGRGFRARRDRAETPRPDPPKAPPKGDPWDFMKDVPDLAFAYKKCRECADASQPWSETMSLDERISRWQYRDTSVDVEALVGLGIPRHIAARAQYPFRLALICAGRPESEWLAYERQMTEMVHERALVKSGDTQPTARRKPGGAAPRSRPFIPRDMLPAQWAEVSSKILKLHAERYSSDQIAGQLAADFGLERGASTIRDWLRALQKEQSSPEA